MLEIQCIYQNDPLWKDIPLGYQDEETIGSWGGLLTAITMVVNLLGYDESPESVNDKLKDHGGFVGALPVPAMLPILFPKVRYKGYVSCEDTQAPLESIDAMLEDGFPVIVQVDWNPDAGIFTHWVLLKARSGDDYVICDPFRYRGDRPEKTLMLSSRYKKRGEDPAQAITAVLWLEKKFEEFVPGDKVESLSPALEVDDAIETLNDQESFSSPDAESEILPAEPHSLVLVPTVEGVAFRSEPVIKLETEIRRLTLDDQMEPIDPLDEALNKIGQQGQWIYVEDQDGQSGYVAAWYMKVQG